MQEKQQFIQAHIRGLMPLKCFTQLEEELDVVIETIPKMNVAYIRKFYFDLQDEPAIIHRMFDYITAWGRQKGLIGTDTLVLGIIHDNPYLTPFSQYQYDACITVQHPVRTDGIVGVKTVPEGRYAILKLKNANMETLQKSIFTFLTLWLPKSGYYIDNGTILEFYHSPDTGGNFTMDFCAPVNCKDRK
jgi:AraC family transcriptional regulator